MKTTGLKKPHNKRGLLQAKNYAYVNNGLTRIFWFGLVKMKCLLLLTVTFL